MICKNCGNEIPIMLVINTNPFTLNEYFDYKENGDGKCIKCFISMKRSIKVNVFESLLKPNYSNIDMMW